MLKLTNFDNVINKKKENTNTNETNLINKLKETINKLEVKNDELLIQLTNNFNNFQN